MTKSDLKDKIKNHLLSKYGKKDETLSSPVEYDEFAKHPELKQVILDLLTQDYNSFMSSIDWVAPKPTMFRINLRNDQNFYLTWNERTWIAQIEGKKYYLLNTPEKQRALESLSRLLRYGAKEDSTKQEVPDGSSESSPLDNMEAEAEPETEK